MTAAVLMFSFSAASAESFDFSVTLDAALNVTSPNDNFWGIYSTADPQSVLVSLRAGGQAIDLTLGGASFLLPVGSTIVTATMSLVLPEDIGGTAQGFPAGENLPSPDQTSKVSVAPTFGIGALGLTVEGLDDDPYRGPNGGTRSGDMITFSLPSDSPVINGNEVSTGAPVVILDVFGDMQVPPLTPGYNWAGYVNATGTAEVPYTLDISGTYTPPVPEPSSLILLGTGALGLAGPVRRRFCRRAESWAPEALRSLEPVVVGLTSAGAAS